MNKNKCKEQNKIGLYCELCVCCVTLGVVN